MTLQALVAAGRLGHELQLLAQRRQEHLADERALARAAHAGDHRERSERDAQLDVLQVVLRGAGQDQLLGAHVRSARGARSTGGGGERATGRRFRDCQHLLGRALGHHAAAA